MSYPNTVAKIAQVTNELTSNELKDVAIERLKWENRRKMAWVFIYAIMAFTFLILTIIVVAPKDIYDRIIHATDLLTWLFIGLMGIPSLYFGATVAEKFTRGPTIGGRRDV